MESTKPARRNPWWWIPTLYYAEGIPYVVVMTVSVIMYKRLGVPNEDIAFFTSILYLPWVIKPLWSPIVDMFKTKRHWIIIMQFVVGVCLGGVALTIPVPAFLQYTLAFFFIMAFSSATHDIAADGFYMLGLEEHEQAFFVGVRSTFYRAAMITGQGLLVMLAGYFEKITPSVSTAWQYTFFIITAFFLLFGIYHLFILPKPATDKSVALDKSKGFFHEFFKTFILFFKKPGIGLAITFLLIYRFGEAQLVKLASPFLLDPRNIGGLGLDTGEVGLIYGTIGVGALLAGGITGGILAATFGLKRMIWWMFAAINIPHLLYIYLAYAQPENMILIGSSVAGEQFGYGFGFTAYMLYMIMISEGDYKTSHYAICTGFMALSMMIPGLFSGYIQQWLGYQLFFVWILVAMIPGIFIIRLLKIPDNFGLKKKKEKFG